MKVEEMIFEEVITKMFNDVEEWRVKRWTRAANDELRVCGDVVMSS